MIKKTKTPAPLPSGLSVANPSRSLAAKTPAKSGKKSPARVEAEKAPSRKPKTNGSLSPQVVSGGGVPEAPLVKSKRLAAKEKSPSASALKARDVRFVIFEPSAKQVFLCGGFNGWSPDTTPLTLQEDGEWTTDLKLPPGRYEYKFIVDGKWTPDPRARENVFNEYGTINSLLEVKV